MSYSLGLIESIEQSPKDISEQDGNVNKQIRDVLNQLETIREKMLYPARFELLRFIEKQEHIALKETQITYTIKGDNKEFTFPKVSAIDNISNLPEVTINAMIEWLVWYAQSHYAVSSERDKDYCNDLYRFIPSGKRARKKTLEYMAHGIERLIRSNEWSAVTSTEQRYKKVEFTYYRAYELGHMLHFTRDEMEAFILHVFPNTSAIRKTVRDAVEAYCFNYGLHEASMETALSEQKKHLPINYISEEAGRILFSKDKDLLAWRKSHELKVEEDSYYKYYKTHADLLMIAAELAKEKGVVVPMAEDELPLVATKDLFEKFSDKTGQGDSTIINMCVWYDLELNRPTRTAYKVYVNTLLCAYMMIVVSNGIVYRKSKHIKGLLSALSLVPGFEKACPIDNIYDPAAESVVKKYQRERGLTVNGVVDQATQQAIIDDLDARISQMESIINKLKSSNGQTLRKAHSKADTAPDELVTALQKALILLGEHNYDCGFDKEGVFGEGTERSVRNYQRYNKLLQSKEDYRSTSIPGEADDICIKHIIQRIEHKQKKYIAAKASVAELNAHPDIRRNILAENTIRNADGTISNLWKTYMVDRKSMKEYVEQHHEAFYLPSFDTIDWQDVSLSFSSVHSNKTTDSFEYNQDFLVDLSLDTNNQFVANSIYNRIPDLIERKRPIEKRDLLALIWMIVILYLESANPVDIDNGLYKTPSIMLDKIQGILETANFAFYEANPLEYSITRAWLIYYWKRNRESLGDIYSEIVNGGQNDIRSQEINITTKTASYGIWFYACGNETQDSIQKMLQDISVSGVIKHLPNDDKRYLTAVVSTIADQLKCGWQWLPSNYTSREENALYMNSFGLIGGETKEIVIKDEPACTVYRVRFIGCTEQSLKRIAKLLYHCSIRAKTEVYNDSCKHLKHIAQIAANTLRCDFVLQRMDCTCTANKWMILDQKGILRPYKQEKTDNISECST